MFLTLFASMVIQFLVVISLTGCVYTFSLGVTSNKNPYIAGCLNTDQADIVLTLIVSFNCFNVNKQDH